MTNIEYVLLIHILVVIGLWVNAMQCNAICNI